MSNKKQPFIVKTSPIDATAVPPRYQPPPQPNPGILKHPAKDAKGYPPGPAPVKPQEQIKPPYPPDPKFFPVQQAVKPPYTHIQGYQYPPVRQDPARIPRFEGRPEENLQQRRFEEQDMLKFVRKPEDNRIPLPDNRHVQSLMNDLRSLKEANQRLADDNQELRDLCCFLDDDRQKGRKLAREWQRFGRYTASVMRQEVSAYQSKLRELDNKQQELIKDNLELKELCLYLDEERSGSAICPSCGSSTNGNLRDDGDGSSSSTNADEPGMTSQFNNAPRRSASRERLLHDNLQRQRNTFNDQTMQYVRTLEARVKQLEDDKRSLLHKLSQVSPEAASDPGTDANGEQLSGRPEAVVRALQVLEVREQLEGPREQPRVPERQGETRPEEDMDDGEKALVREMCNVVWRKLEEGPQPRR